MTLKIANFFFALYHLLFPSMNRSCRFEPTCSKYALESLEKHGPVKGSYHAIKRVLSCHPFSKRPLYDPA